MTVFVFANYINTTLAAAVTNTDTTLTLASSANLPTLATGQIMALTLNDAATGLVYEIVYVTDISGTTLTVERAQEGTTAQNWSAGDFAFVAPTADTVAPVVSYARPTVSETLIISNNLVVQPGTLSANITLTLPSAPRIGVVYTIYGSASAYTVTVASSVSSGSPSINTPDGTAIYSYVIPASSPYRGIICVWDGTNWRAQTFGNTVVANATASNQAISLGQAQADFAALNGSSSQAFNVSGPPNPNTSPTAAVSAQNFPSSLTTNGWKKYPDPNSPSGYVIEQWGSATVAANSSGITVTFPIAFPNKILSLSLASGVSTSTFSTFQSLTLTNFFLQAWISSPVNTPTTGNAAAFYFAKGY